MKKTTVLLTIFCFIGNILIIPPIFAGEDSESKKTTIAIMNLEAKDVSQSEADTVSDFLRYDLLNTGKFEVIERTSMEKVLAEQKLQLTGCTSTECAIEIGKLLNVKKIIIGTVSKLGNNYFITARIVNVETGKIESSERAKCAGKEELELGSKVIAYKFAGIKVDEKTLKGEQKLVMEEETPKETPKETYVYQPLPRKQEPVVPQREETTGETLLDIGGILGTVAGVLGLTFGYIYSSSADEEYDKYLTAYNEDDAKTYHENVEKYDKNSNTGYTISLIGGITMIVCFFTKTLIAKETNNKASINTIDNFKLTLTSNDVNLAFVVKKF